MQQYMVSGLYQTELEQLPPDKQSGRPLDEEMTARLTEIAGKPMKYPKGVKTEQQAAQYLQQVTQRLQEAK